MRKLTTKEFIEKAKGIHGDKYDYSKVEYVNNKSKVVITCPIHGDFLQKPNGHLNGNGCKKCYHKKLSKVMLYNEKDFTEKAKLIHGDKYDYSKVEYKNSQSRAIITCPEHGDFEQKPVNHLNGAGCPKCGIGLARYKRTFTTEQFIEKAKGIHGDWYDYSKVEYKDSSTKIIVICPDHGEFEQIPSSHLFGHGCPNCAKDSSLFWNPEFILKYYPEYSNNPCTLYVLECYSDEERFIKVGITTKTVEERYNCNSKLNWYSYNTLYEYQSTLIECSEIEQEVLKQFKDYQYEPMNKFGGSTECFTYEVVDDIITKIKGVE